MNIYTGDNLSIKLPTFEFDGQEFPGNWRTMPSEQVPFFDIAYRAKRGDEAAIAVAKACRLYIADVDGKTYIDCR